MRGLTHLLRVVQASRGQRGRESLSASAAGPTGKTLALSAEMERDSQPLSIAIQAIGLSKTLGGRRVLRELDLEVAEGKIVAITGANGSGKTTLLRCLSSLCRPTAGEVRLFGHALSAGAAVRRLVGLSAHETLLYPYLTARENLVFTARMYGVPDAARRADQLIRSVGLSRHADRWAATLSRGMRQRLAVVRALVHDPPILLLDEPFSGLDECAAHWLANLILDMRARRRTVCFTTHDPHTARTLADRVFHLQSGRLEEREPGHRLTVFSDAPLPAARAA